MTSQINFMDLKLTQATFEVRYDNSYFLWDRAGVIWTKITSLWPDLKIERIEPSITTFKLENKYQLSVNLDKAYIVDLKPSSSLKEFMEKANDFIRLISQTLEIINFTRIGFRLIYIKNFPDKYAAANSLLSTKMMIAPEGRQFNIEGKAFLPKYSLVWEGDSSGARILLEVRDKKIDFEAHPAIEELNSIHIEKHELVYDVDYYALAKVSIGQLNIKEWLDQIYHLIKRDSKTFLGGS
jgi:hypothetical protein